MGCLLSSVLDVNGENSTQECREGWVSRELAALDWRMSDTHGNLSRAHPRHGPSLQGFQ